MTLRRYSAQPSTYPSRRAPTASRTQATALYFVGIATMSDSDVTTLRTVLDIPVSIGTGSVTSFLTSAP
jgi:hypothetical protein